MTFKEFAKYIQQIELLSSRLQITEILANLFNKCTPDEYEKAVYLLVGRLTPKFEILNFGMAEKMVIRAIAQSLQIGQSDFTKKYKKIGDIGETTLEYKKTQSSMFETELSLTSVFCKLDKIAKSQGKGSQDTKISLFSSLMQELDPLSAKYVVRIPLGVLRLGFSDMTILDALSWMCKGDKSLRPMLQKAYQVHPDLGIIGKKLKEAGINAVYDIKPDLFTPILMMRAERLSSGIEIIDQIGECAVESKFDGFRLQVHKKGDIVRLYTRSLEDTTYMYPDIVEGVKKEIKVSNLIIEGEAIGYDIKKGTFLSFQDTVQRKRKYGIAEKAIEIPLKLFVFELLYLEGENYVSQPFTKRRQALASIIKLDKDYSNNSILIAEEKKVSNPEEIETMFDRAISKGLEGIIAKKLNGTYEPGARGWNWIKFKRSYSSKIEDTIDCLVMGYDYGKGKRTKFGIGAFLVGVYDSKDEKYKTIAKIGTGLTDDEWTALQKSCRELIVKTKPKDYEVDKIMEVDVWVLPELVVEIRADEISRSEVHTAGRTMKQTDFSSRREISKAAYEVDIAGFALRFPRLERFRNDKDAHDITTIEELGKMFESQKK